MDRQERQFTDQELAIIMPYVRHMGSRVIPKEEKKFFSMGPVDVCRKLARLKIHVTPAEILRLKRGVVDGDRSRGRDARRGRG